MTTQPNQDNVVAFMREHGFHYLDDEDHYWHHQTRMIVTGSQAQFWYTTIHQSNRQLLDEVEAAGPKDAIVQDDEDLENECSTEALKYEIQENNINFGRNEANRLWHQAIQAIKERRGL